MNAGRREAQYRQLSDFLNSTGKHAQFFRGTLEAGSTVEVRAKPMPQFFGNTIDLVLVCVTEGAELPEKVGVRFTAHRDDGTEVYVGTDADNRVKTAHELRCRLTATLAALSGVAAQPAPFHWKIQNTSALRFEIAGVLHDDRKFLET